MSWFFFILTPFGFFCTENGTGLITGTVFLILGFIFRWIESGGFEPTTKVESKDWWETNYKINMTQGRGHEISKDIADYTTMSNHCYMPSEEEKERIARKLGVVTPQMRYDEEDKWNRIQVEKVRLMEDLYKKYKEIGKFCSDDYAPRKRGGRVCFPYMYIEYSIKVLKGFIKVYKWNRDPWTAHISESEKAVAKKWIEEYEERLLKEVNDYIENGVRMPTIQKHYDRGGCIIPTDFDVKYGFCKK